MKKPQLLIHLLTIGLCGIFVSIAFAQVSKATPATPPTLFEGPVPSAQNVTAVDFPSDAGNKIRVSFAPAPGEGPPGLPISAYDIYRAASPSGPWAKVGSAVPDVSESISFADEGSADSASANFLPNGVDFVYRVRSVTPDSAIFADSEPSAPAQASGQYWNQGRAPVFAFVFLFTVLTLWFIRRAKTHSQNLYIRPLGGIAAVDEAIGRATEMGRPILYVMGLGTASDISTIAAFTVLGRVAKRVAEYQTSLIVPCYDPIVFTIAQEVVKTGYLDAGRGQDYIEDNVYFVTQSQFAYVAAVNGTMLRERPATNFYLGKFYAESLLLAETGALAGSIQISGTDEIAQLPFFVVACDYTLIGEELYAASAYLGREPLLLGALKAQDYAKAAIVALAIGGTLAAIFGFGSVIEMFRTQG